MIPSEHEHLYCIVDDEGEIADGAHGLGIDDTEQRAWERILDPCEDWSINRAKELGFKVRRCFIGVINP